MKPRDLGNALACVAAPFLAAGVLWLFYVLAMTVAP